MSTTLNDMEQRVQAAVLSGEIDPEEAWRREALAAELALRKVLERHLRLQLAALRMVEKVLGQ